MKGLNLLDVHINNVFCADALDIKYEEGKTFIEYKDDTIQYRVITEDYDMTIDVSSFISEYRGIEGKTISNTDAALTIKFNKPQKLRTLFKHYNKIRDVLSFMTFRNNVDFNKIYLEKKDNEIWKVKYLKLNIELKKVVFTKIGKKVFKNNEIAKIVYDVNNIKRRL